MQLKPVFADGVIFTALIVIVYGDGDCLFSLVLPDNVFVEARADFLRLGQFALVDGFVFRRVFLQNVIAQLDATVANVDALAGYQLPHDVLRLAAK